LKEYESFTAKKSVNETPASVEVLRKMNSFSDLKDNNERIEMFLKLLDELYQSWLVKQNNNSNKRALSKLNNG
jgi:HD-GYP domain-containing protein (c-di-GMP phosphodiesterase class II)